MRGTASLTGIWIGRVCIGDGTIVSSDLRHWRAASAKDSSPQKEVYVVLFQSKYMLVRTTPQSKLVVVEFWVGEEKIKVLSCHGQYAMSMDTDE